MAAAAAASARVAHAVSLGLFYGSDSNYANSNNGIFIGSAYDPTGANTNATGVPQSLTGTVTSVTPNVAGPTTINMPIGSYLSIALDAVLTKNLNAAAGTQQPGDGFVQPSFLGLGELSMLVTSSDAHGVVLTPYSTATAPSTTISGLVSYQSTAIINSAFGTNGGGGYNAIPIWGQQSSPGDVQPNLPGYDTAPNSSGGVGVGGTSPTGGAFPNGSGNPDASGRTSVSLPTSTAEAVLEAFASADNTASYAAATDFLDSLTFKALAAGTVTLAPSAVTGGTLYWQYNGSAPVSGKFASTYRQIEFGAADTVGSFPALVVNITSAAIPEPATDGLLALSAVGLLARRHRPKNLG
jgi:hypothetical protein